MVASTRPVFDRLFETALGPIRAGDHRRDHPPVEGGRWPVSVVAGGLTDENRAVLAALTRQAASFAGPGHFLTGHPRAVHVTVRALESYRDAAAPDDPVVRCWCEALERCATRTPPLTLLVSGVTLTTSGVLALLECVDDRPWQMQHRLAEELGPLGAYESGFDRNIWYCSLLHFTGDIRDPDGLIEWVAAHRELDTPQPLLLTSLDLVRFHHVTEPTATYMQPHLWSSFQLSSGRP